jgi:hypothetical protein
MPHVLVNEALGSVGPGTARLSQTFFHSGRDAALGEMALARSARIAVAAALLLAGTSLATARIRAASAAHDNRNPGIITKATSRPTAADPYYRLSDPYYGYSDPYRGLYDFYTVPPDSPGYTYGHVKPGGWK